MYSKYKIEKNIPITSKGALFPFSEMEIGDSFEVPLETTSQPTIQDVQKVVLNEARQYAKVNAQLNRDSVQQKHTTRTALDSKSVRCWRLV